MYLYVRPKVVQDLRAGIYPLNQPLPPVELLAIRYEVIPTKMALYLRMLVHDGVLLKDIDGGYMPQDLSRAIPGAG